MTLKEFAEKIISNKEIWDYTVNEGFINIDDDICDESHLYINTENITIVDYYVNNIKVL